MSAGSPDLSSGFASPPSAHAETGYRPLSARFPFPVTEERLSLWSSTDTVCLLSAMALFVVVPIFCGRGRIFWEDEMLGYMLLRDPSFSHMVAAWKHGADGGGFSFYLTGRLWFKLFGASVFSFRLYSQFFFAIAFAFSWLTLRRFYCGPVVALAALSVWLVSPALVQQMTYGRFYGLLMAAVAAAIWLSVSAASRTRLPAWFYLAVLFVNALVVTSHVLGVVFSFVVLCSIMVLDHLHGRRRHLFYLASALPWLLLIPSLPGIHASAAVGKPYFWTMQPGVRDFITNYTGFTLTLGIPFALLLAAVAVGHLANESLRTALEDGWRRRQPVYVVTGLFFLIPVIFYGEGTFGPALCISRYLQPVAFASMFFLAELLTLGLMLIPSRLKTSRPVWAAVLAAFLLILGTYDFVYRPQHTTLQKDYTVALTGKLPQGVPIVCEDAFAFTELIGRQHDSPVRYTYLLDWQNSLVPDIPRLEVTQFHLMQNWKQVGYFSGSIQYAGPFLQQNPVFYSVSFEDAAPGPLSGLIPDRRLVIGSRLHERMALNPGYKVTLWKSIPLGDLTASVWRICRRGSASCG